MSNQEQFERRYSTDFEFVGANVSRDNVVPMPQPTRLIKPRLSILGLGYVGAVSSACFSRQGHQVIGVDPDASKVQQINLAQSPIVEAGLTDLLSAGREQGRLFATRYCHEAILESDVTLVSVGTPSDAQGGCDLRYLKEATANIGAALKQKSAFHVVIFRSTVPPRTTRDELIPILEAESGKVCGEGFSVCFNPEFLRESTAVDDFFHPPKTVMGATDAAGLRVARLLYSDMPGEYIETSLEAAEFVKYIDNTWHALKVSFANEVGRLCKASGVDSHDVMDIFLADTKLNISPYYLKPGFAFGGSCLPKDTRGISHLARQLNVDIPIIQHINDSNHEHIDHATRLIDDLDVAAVGLVGVTFKPDTDDLRESPLLILIKKLWQRGMDVRFFDPCVHSKSVLDRDPELNQRLLACRCDSVEELAEQSQALVLGHNTDYAQRVLKLAAEDIHIIDLVRVSKPMASCENYQGVCW